MPRLLGGPRPAAAASRGSSGPTIGTHGSRTRWQLAGPNGRQRRSARVASAPELSTGPSLLRRHVMSTPTPARPAARATATIAVPQPRPSADPPVDASTDPRPANRHATLTDPVGVWGRKPWLVPALGIACVIAVFVSMLLLTWAAGGTTPFDR